MRERGRGNISVQRFSTISHASHPRRDSCSAGETLRNTMNDQLRMLNHLQQVESKAAEILTDKQEVIDLDKRRNDDRVGFRALQKQKGDKAWITVGPILLKMDTKKAEHLLVEDQRECDIAINKIRSELKVKVNELRDLERDPPVPGLMLKPMSHEEMSAINHLIGKSL